MHIVYFEDTLTERFSHEYIYSGKVIFRLQNGRLPTGL